MKTTTMKQLATLAVLVLAMSAAHGDNEFLLHGRVSFDTGTLLVKSPDDADWSAAVVNTLIMGGDTLWVDESGTAELEMSGASFLRLADSSKAEISALPPSAYIRGWTGSFYIQRLTRSRGDFIFTTPVATLDIGVDTMARVDIDVTGATTVSVRWGQVLLRTDHGGDTMATEGTRVWIDPGFLPSEPTPFDRNEADAFDSWNNERARLLAEGLRTQPKEVVIRETTVGYTDLPRYGEWVYIDSRPYWRPTVVVNYVPYRHGYWNYVPGVGHVWVGEYPFAYVTSHYGRWRHTVAYGWVWSYDPVWSPAWVASVRVGDYYLWSPVDYYYRPVIVASSATFVVGGVSFCSYSTSYVSATYIYSGPTYVYAPTTVVINTFVNTPPRQVHVWAIAPDRGRRPSVPYDPRYIAGERDYSPRRSIRGAQGTVAQALAPAERAQRLESGLGRQSFATQRQEPTRSIRTAASDSTRVARARQVNLAQTEQVYRNTAIRDAQPSEQSRRNMLVPESTRLGRMTGGDAFLRETARPERQQPDARPGQTVAVTPETRGGNVRTGDSAPDASRRSGVTPTRPDGAVGAPADRVALRDMESATPAPRQSIPGGAFERTPVRTETSAPSQRRENAPSTSIQRTTPAPASTPSVRQNAPSTSPQRTAPAPTPAPTPSVRQNVPSTSPQRTAPAPTPSVRQNVHSISPQRTAPAPTPAPTPSVRQNVHSISPQRTAPAPTPAPTPSVRQNVPSTSPQRTAPAPTPAPTPSVRQNVPSTSPQRTAPAPAPTPVMRQPVSRPTPAPSTQRQAPTPAPRFEAPRQTPSLPSPSTSAPATRQISPPSSSPRINTTPSAPVSRPSGGGGSVNISPPSRNNAPQRQITPPSGDSNRSGLRRR